MIVWSSVESWELLSSLLDFQFQKVTEVVKHNSPNSDIKKVWREHLISNNDEEHWHLKMFLIQVWTVIYSEKLYWFVFILHTGSCPVQPFWYKQTLSSSTGAAGGCSCLAPGHFSGVQWGRESCMEGCSELLGLNQTDWWSKTLSWKLQTDWAVDSQWDQQD